MQASNDIRSRIGQGLRTVGMISPKCFQQRCFTGIYPGVHVCPSLDQRLQAGEVASSGSVMERPAAITFCGLNIRPESNQSLYAVSIAHFAGNTKRCGVPGGGSKLQVGPGIDQGRQTVEVAGGGSAM